MRSSISPERRRSLAASVGRAVRFLLLAWLVPTPAAACPICFGSVEPEVLRAFYWSTAALTLLPLAIVGITVGAIARLRRRAEAQRTGRNSTLNAGTNREGER